MKLANLFANLRIGARLGLGFSLVLALLMGIAALGAIGMGQTNDALHHVVDVNVYKMNALEDMSQALHGISNGLNKIVLLTAPDASRAEADKIAEARKIYNARAETVYKMQLDEQSKALFALVKENRVASRALNDRVIALGLANKDKEASELLIKEAGPATAKWQRSMQDFIELQKAANKQDIEQATIAYKRSLLLMLGLSTLAVLVGAAIAWSLTRSITGPLRTAVRVAQTVAAGDLSSHIEAGANDETGQLLRALKDMNDGLITIVSDVRQGTHMIATASGQIAAGNHDLSARTEQQASSLEQTAASMEELTSTVKQNADNARQANVLAASASGVAVEGGAVVAQVVETMASINTSSKKIVDIISVIDGIAFQTNILALNAAVEAARAGEQGRGFAVVAGEVRSLAQRSAQAAKEIKTLIDDSVDKVEGGSRLVDQAGATMVDIVASVKRVTGIIEEIASASSEQTAGIEQISQAVTQMDQVTQQNAALVEQASAAAEALQDQANRLEQTVAVFKLDSRSAARALARSAPPKLLASA